MQAGRKLSGGDHGVEWPNQLSWEWPGARLMTWLGRNPSVAQWVATLVPIGALPDREACKKRERPSRGRPRASAMRVPVKVVAVRGCPQYLWGHL